MATTEYQNSHRLVHEVTLDHVAENLKPESVLLPMIPTVPIPNSTQTRTLRKKGELFRQTLAENTQGQIQEYTEDFTALNSIKQVVIVENTVEAIDFSTEPALPMVQAVEAAKAFAVGMDEDIAALFNTATSSITAAAPNLTLLEVLAAALNVNVSTRGHSVKRDGGLVFVGSHKQYFDAVDVGALNPATGANLNIYGNAASNIPAANNDSVNVAPTGFRANIAGLDFYSTEILDDDGTNYFGAVFNPKRAFVGMNSEI